MPGNKTGGQAVDLENPNSILTRIEDIKVLINSKTMALLPPDDQYKLIMLLPKCDRQFDDDGMLRASSEALNNEFFSKSCSEWKERLLDGDFTAENQQRLKAEREKEQKVDAWKLKHFEAVWGDLRRNSIPHLHSSPLKNDGRTSNNHRLLSSLLAKKTVVTSSCSNHTVIAESCLKLVNHRNESKIDCQTSVDKLNLRQVSKRTKLSNLAGERSKAIHIRSSKCARSLNSLPGVSGMKRKYIMKHIGTDDWTPDVVKRQKVNTVKNGPLRGRPKSVVVVGKVHKSLGSPQRRERAPTVKRLLEVESDDISAVPSKMLIVDSQLSDNIHENRLCSLTPELSQPKPTMPSVSHSLLSSAVCSKDLPAEDGLTARITRAPQQYSLEQRLQAAQLNLRIGDEPLLPANTINIDIRKGTAGHSASQGVNTSAAKAAIMTDIMTMLRTLQAAEAANVRPRLGPPQQSVSSSTVAGPAIVPTERTQLIVRPNLNAIGLLPGGLVATTEHGQVLSHARLLSALMAGNSVNDTRPSAVSTIQQPLPSARMPFVLVPQSCSSSAVTNSSSNICGSTERLLNNDSVTLKAQSAVMGTGQTVYMVINPHSTPPNRPPPLSSLASPSPCPLVSSASISSSLSLAARTPAQSKGVATANLYISQLMEQANQNLALSSNQCTVLSSNQNANLLTNQNASTVLNRNTIPSPAQLLNLQQAAQALIALNARQIRPQSIGAQHANSLPAESVMQQLVVAGKQSAAPVQNGPQTTISNVPNQVLCFSPPRSVPVLSSAVTLRPPIPQGKQIIQSAQPFAVLNQAIQQMALLARLNSPITQARPVAAIPLAGSSSSIRQFLQTSPQYNRPTSSPRATLPSTSAKAAASSKSRSNGMASDAVSVAPPFSKTPLNIAELARMTAAFIRANSERAESAKNDCSPQISQRSSAAHLSQAISSVAVISSRANDTSLVLNRSVVPAVQPTVVSDALLAARVNALFVEQAQKASLLMRPTVESSHVNNPILAAQVNERLFEQDHKINTMALGTPVTTYCDTLLVGRTNLLLVEQAQKVGVALGLRGQLTVTTATVSSSTSLTRVNQSTDGVAQKHSLMRMLLIGSGVPSPVIQASTTDAAILSATITNNSKAENVEKKLPQGLPQKAEDPIFMKVLPSLPTVETVSNCVDGNDK